MEVAVKSVTQEAPRIRSFTVFRPAGVNPTPGQFFMLSRARVGEVPISVRSITPSELGFTVRRVGAVTTALTTLEVGDTVGLRGPFGRGFVVAGSGEGRGQDDGASNLVLIAGGLGIVPLQPLIQAWPQSKKNSLKKNSRKKNSPKMARPKRARATRAHGLSTVLAPRKSSCS